MHYIVYYFKGFAKLPDRPSVSHNSVSHGQIRLIIPSPGSPETQGAVFYRILCSTNQYFSNPFLCHPDLVPVATPGVVLDNLDITTPLYAKVNVLRNFNGEEYPEYGIDTATTFCAGKLAMWPVRLGVIHHNLRLYKSCGNKSQLYYIQKRGSAKVVFLISMRRQFYYWPT